MARKHGQLDGPWNLLAVEMSDGTVRVGYELPPAYPPALRACDHAITADGGWSAYIAAPVGPPDNPQLFLGSFDCTWPESANFTQVAGPVNVTYTAYTPTPS